MNTLPNGMQRRQPRKAEIYAIAKRLFPDADIIEDLSRAGLKAYIRKHGRCELSGKPFNGGVVHYDHVTPNAILFEKDDIDWQVLSPEAHAEKTRRDRQVIAKCDRLMGRTGQVKRREARGRSLIQGRTKIEGRGFDAPPPGYKHFGRRTSNAKVID